MSIVLAVVAGFAACIGSHALCSLVFARAQVLRRNARAPTLDEVLADRVLRNAIFLAVAAVLSCAFAIEAFPLLVGVALLLAHFAPGYVAKRRKAKLRNACDSQLNTMADIVAMGLKAGLSFDAALGLYLAKFDGELAYEMQLAHASWTGGLATREKALLDAAARVGSKNLKRFAEMVVQALKYGSPLSGMLTSFAEEMRLQRHAQIERQVEKAPVKMLIPMGTCILPAMLIFVMGPVILEFMGT